jgi:hypothetical protein
MQKLGTNIRFPPFADIRTEPLPRDESGSKLPRHCGARQGAPREVAPQCSGEIFRTIQNLPLAGRFQRQGGLLAGFGAVAVVCSSASNRPQAAACLRAYGGLYRAPDASAQSEGGRAHGVRLVSCERSKK